MRHKRRSKQKDLIGRGPHRFVIVDQRRGLCLGAGKAVGALPGLSAQEQRDPLHGLDRLEAVVQLRRLGTIDPVVLRPLGMPLHAIDWGVDA